MDWLPCRTAAVLFILMVSLEFSTCHFEAEVRELNENGAEKWKNVRRQKREWIKFAAACRENEDNSRRNPIARIRSDCEETQQITYKISGAGIDRHPFGVFIVNQRTGEINITKIVDREETPMFIIQCFAINSVTGISVETPLELRVRVLDVNDNPPIFTQSVFAGRVLESSMESTLVMKITATDADEPNNLNSKIAYKIETQTPGGPSRFILNTETGELHIANILDREEHASYTLVVKGTDRDGGPGGISSECICEVSVEDVNDNFPTCSQSSYSASISENSLSDDLLRIQVIDADEEFSDNWLAEFFFISGNENQNFEIVVDQRTNQGILKVVKEIDFEQYSNMPLRIGVRNVAPFHSSVASLYQPQGIPITIQINNVVEGPRFSPSSIMVTASEGMTAESILIHKVGTFQAIDQDTGGIATNVRYEMGRDPAAWFRINPTTAVITFNKVIDRESIYVVNGVYTAEVLAITTGYPYRTATGTIQITIEDTNDNCPTLTTELRKVCMDTPSVVITAKDLDSHPYGAPFTYTIVAQSQNSAWQIRRVDETSAELSFPGMDFYIYEVHLRVTDNSGRSCERPQIVPLQACHCDNNRMCTKSATRRITVIISGGGSMGGGGGSMGGGGGGGSIGGGGGGGSMGGGGGGGSMGGGGGGGSMGGGGGGGSMGGGGGGGSMGGGGGGGSMGGGGGGGSFGGGGIGGGGGGGGNVDGGDVGRDFEPGTGVSAGQNVFPGPGRQGFDGTSLSGAAIALMFLGGLIFVLVPILMSQSGCCGLCGSGPVGGGGGVGFEPVPECTDGAIHSWGIEGAQPEDRDVSNICGGVKTGRGEFGDTSDIYTTKYGDGVMGNVGVEEVTGLGAAKGYGTTVEYGNTAGYGTTSCYGTGRKDTFGGTMKEYRESGVNMAFLDSYFSEKAFAYADEDEGRPANDCLLIYDHEGIGSPVGSIGCCSFIGEDLDDTYLDTLGPKFKTLAEICLGVEIEPFPDSTLPRPPFPNPELDISLPPPGTTIVVNASSSMPPPPPVGGTTLVTENTYTATSTMQPPRPMPPPDPMLHGNVVVTETYTTGPTMKPPTMSVDPMRGSNVVVTERVLGPADLHGMIDIPNMAEGSNVVVTERVIAPNSRIPPSMSIPDLGDGSNVVVTERVIRPATSIPGNLSIPSDMSGARNVVVTERVMSGAGMSSVGGVSGMTGQMLGPDALLSQTLGSVSPGTTRRRVTKYSTIQYSNQ